MEDMKRLCVSPFLEASYRRFSGREFSANDFRPRA